MNEAITTMSRIAGAAATAVFIALLIWYLIRYFTESAHRSVIRDSRLPMRPLKVSVRPGRVIFWVFVAFIVSRLTIFLGSVIGAALDSCLDAYLADPISRWIRWDGNHYIGLIENWYVNEGDPRLHIVFFPLYPAICRLMHLATGISAEACAFTVSNAAFLGCGYLIFRLTEITYGPKTAFRALWFMNLSPLTLFCSITYTESVFMLTTLGAVYFARRRMFIPAVIMGALSANSRMVGMATAIPIFYEMLAAVDKKTVKSYLACVLRVLPVALGLIAYLLLNYQVTGHPFTFMEYQSSHWSQNFGSLYNTVGYTFTNAFNFHVESYISGVWRPQLIALFTALILFAFMIKRAHPGDMGYSLIYYYCSVAPTWLLSGPRYLTAMYAAYPFMALIFRSKPAFIAICILLGVRCMAAGAMFAIHGCIL